jgi:hypothetical protein
MHFEINSKSSHRQSTAVLPRLLPDAKIITIPLTARDLSSVLGGHAAGAEWWDEGYVIGDEAWIDDRDGGGIYIRCEDVKGLLRRAAERLKTPAGIIRRYAPTLIMDLNARVAQGKRSSVFFKMGMTLFARGASRAEVSVVLGAMRCWLDKHGTDKRALKAEVTRIMRKSYGRH